MYLKLIKNNVKNSFKNYLIYMITLVLSVSIYYAFFSITSSYYNPSISKEFDITILGGATRYSIIAVSLLIFFLVAYVNRFLMIKKYREFSLQALLGMDRIKIGCFFCIEVGIIGLVSIFIGIILGAFLSQLINLKLIYTFSGEEKFIFPLYMDTIIETFVFFVGIFVLNGIFSINKIKNLKIIDMMNYEKTKDLKFKFNKQGKILILLFFIFNILVLYKSLIYFSKSYDIRIATLAKFYLHICYIIPISNISLIILTYVKKYDFIKTLKILLKMSLISALVYYLAIPIHTNYKLSGGLNKALIYMIIATIYIIYFLLNYFNIYEWNKGIDTAEKLFLKGQINSQVKTQGTALGLINISLFIAFILFFITPILTSWSEGYLNKRMTNDIHVFSSYTKVDDFKKLADNNYDFVFNFLDTKNIEIGDYAILDFYLVNKEDFYKRNKYEFPAKLVKLSQYNKLRSLNGYKNIELDANHFAVQSNNPFQENSIMKPKFNKNNLKLDKVYVDEFSDYTYNDYAEYFYIINDKYIDESLKVMSNLYLNLKEPMGIENNRELEKIAQGIFNENSENNYYRDIRFKTIEKNNITIVNFVLNIFMNYLGLILFIISFTIIGILQIEEISSNKSSYELIYKLGLDQKTIDKIIRSQLNFSFFKPINISLLVSILLLVNISYSLRIVIKKYIDISIFKEIGIIILAISLVVFIYYHLSYIISKSFIKNLNI